MKLFAFLIPFLLLGCASDPSAQTAGFPAPSFGYWINPYTGDKNLAAVAVIRGATDPFDPWGFAHARIAGMSFAFWDGRVRQVQFRADGTVWDDFWWPRKAWLKPGSAAWAGFDFIYGSDPTFVRHRDPRLRDAAPQVTSNRS